MKPYERKCHYHETDQMGVAHHTSYIKWLEEARIYIMDLIGFSYKQMEETGVISPVVSITCNYKKPIKFDDIAIIDIKVLKYTGAKLSFSYVITNQNGDVCVTAESTNCFVKDNNVVSLKRELPEIHEKFSKFVEENKGE